MANRKRIVSRKEQIALIRLNAIKNFDESNKTVINYGSSGKELNSGIYQEQIGKCKEIRDEINTSLEKLDGKSNELNKELRKLSNMNTEILSGIRSKFGWIQMNMNRQEASDNPKGSDLTEKITQQNLNLNQKISGGEMQLAVFFPPVRSLK